MTKGQGKDKSQKQANNPAKSKKWRQGYCTGFAQGVRVSLAYFEDLMQETRGALEDDVNHNNEIILKLYPYIERKAAERTAANKPNVANIYDEGIFAPDYDATVFNQQGKLKLFVRDGLCFYDDSGMHGPNTYPLNHEQVEVFDSLYIQLLAKFRQSPRFADPDCAVGVMVDENQMYDPNEDDTDNQQLAADLADIYVASAGDSDNTLLRDEIYRSLLEQLRLRGAAYDD